MRFLFLLPIVIFLTFEIKSQNLDKIRVVCLDEVDLAQYEGELSKKELQDQIAAIGFRYIENGEIKYHDELVVYNCNTGQVQFTAVFDENRLIKEFVQYESKDVPAKKINFSKKAKSNYVDLKLNYKGQEIAAYPVGKARIFSGGNLEKVILFNEDGTLPIVSNYNVSKQKISEGGAYITGDLQQNWSVKKTGEWTYFENGQVASISTYDNSGDEIGKKLYNNGNLIAERKFLGNGNVEVSQFYASGNIEEKGILRGDNKIGSWQYYNDSGKLQMKVDYLEGVEVQKLFYDDENNLVKSLDLVDDKSELPESLQGLNIAYDYRTFYPSEALSSEGHQSEGNKVGVFEFYDKSGELTEILEYDLEGNEVNAVDAEAYLAIQEKEKNIYRELLVARTTHPSNLNLIENIYDLTDSLGIDDDSVIAQPNYEQVFEKRYSSLESQTSQFGKLSNKLSWYDSLITVAEEFTDETWSYSKDLFEKELALEKEYAKHQLDEKLVWLKENYTSTKNTLFGEKIVVVNEQEEIYESISEEIYPAYKADIASSENKQQVEATLYEFNSLIKKGSSLISQPNEQFKEALENTESIHDKRKLFLSLK